MYTGPKLTNEDLVFGYDTGYGVVDNGSGARFYKGEPTSNILPSPEKNGRFTTENQWGSYNTNQYNSNTYFSIGTVSGVSNNIVTLSSVGQTIRSFDVLKAQTTGGGITAGTNYVIKKLSTTTFSLHEYNSSQNGSQGYINPSTGFFKVHDAYANDTRISINATSFPTMWWGAPHLPNSGLIKEIIPNGGYVKGTNCIRLHIYRGDNVRDGMAYNVYTPVTQGDVITVSYWVRPTNQLGYGMTWNYQTYFGSGNSASSFTTTLNSDGEWQHVVHQWTASVTYNFYSYWFPEASYNTWAMDMADLQVEVNKGHATPFTLTSRSDTASLIDLKRTTDIDMSNSSFNSTGQPTFDGTDDGINLGDNSLFDFTNGVATIEAVVKFPSSWTGGSQYPNLISKGGSAGWDTAGWALYGFRDWPSGTSNKSWGFAMRNGSTVRNVARNGVATDKYVHIVATMDGTTIRLYENGVAQGTTSQTINPESNTTNVYIGRGPSSQYFPGDIPIAKMYNKTLSAAEIKQNFRAYKNRFNL